jgi:hypothetical protein
VPAAQNLNDACIRIKGTFYIDNNLTWNIENNTKVYLDPGASIQVEGGSRLMAYESIFEKCSLTGAPWGQITCMPGSFVKLSCCLLTGFLSGVVALTNAAFDITGSEFNSRGGTGIKIFGTPALHEVYNNQFLECSTGILANGAAFVTIDYNWFYDSQGNMVGINLSGTGTSFATIKNCIMVNQSTGIEASFTGNNIQINNVTISGRQGIKAINCLRNLSISNSSVRTSHEGIYIDQHQTSLGLNFGAVTVTNSYVSSIFRSALKVTRLYGNGRLQIQGNTIAPPYDPSPPPSFSYYGIEIDDARYAQVFVQQNTVRHLSFIADPVQAPGGIYLKDCRRETLIEDNYVYAGPNGKLQQGIILVESKNVQIANNTVLGGLPWMDMAGISIGKSPENILLCCNTIDDSEIGLYLSESISNYDIAGTVFNTHEAALYYNVVAALADESQYHRGNDWSNASTTWDGVYQGDASFIPLTRYFVDPSLLADDSKITVNSGGNDNDWFNIENETEYSCGDFCGHTAYEPVFAPPGGSGIITANDEWAAETLGDLPGYAAIHWDARRDLYSKLMCYPAMLNTNATIDDFFDEAASGNIGLFYDIEDGLYRLYESPTTIEEDYYDAHETLAAQFADLNDLDETLEEADSTAVPGLLALRDSMVAELEITLAVIAVYDSIIAEAVPQRLSDLITLNASIVPDADYEEFQQDINAIYLNARYADDWDFDSTTQAAIDAIALLCPHEAGRAVYDARSLQEHYRVPTWTNCAPIDAPRTSTATLLPVRNGFSAYPNPAADAVQLTFDPPVRPDTRVLLTDMTGRIRMDAPVANGATNMVLPVSMLQNGTYLIKVQSRDQVAAQQKLIIIH